MHGFCDYKPERKSAAKAQGGFIFRARTVSAMGTQPRPHVDEKKRPMRLIKYTSQSGYDKYTHQSN